MTATSHSDIQDFRVFLQICWQHLGLPEPTPVQYDIGAYLQKGPRRLVIEAFRGVGKSYITSAFVAHQLLLDPEKKILVVSASKIRSDDFSTFVQRLIIEMRVLQHLAPAPDQRNSKISFDVGPATASHSPSVKSVGITGQLAGSRADLIVADDVEVPNNSATQLMRDKLSESIKEFDAILKPNGRIVFLGTPQTEQSLYDLLPERGYETRIWPAQYPEEGSVSKYGNRLAPLIRKRLDSGKASFSDPTDPKRFDATDLEERRLSYGRAGYALQFMLDTSLSDMDRYPLRLQDLIVMNLNSENAPQKIVWSPTPEGQIQDLPCVGLRGDAYYEPFEVASDWIEYNGSLMTIDPAGRGKDETAYTVTKFLNGYVFLLDFGGFLETGYSEKTLSTLAELAHAFSINHVLVEANWGDGMFTEMLRPYLNKTHPVEIEEVKHFTNKEKRIIDTLEPVMNQHKLVVSKKALHKDFQSTQNLPPESALSYQLAYQMTRITYQKGAINHDDRLDALAIAVNYWTEHLALTADRAIEKRNEHMLNQDLKRFIRNLPINRGGPRKPKPAVWFEG